MSRLKEYLWRRCKAAVIDAELMSKPTRTLDFMVIARCQIKVGQVHGGRQVGSDSQSACPSMSAAVR